MDFYRSWAVQVANLTNATGHVVMGRLQVGCDRLWAVWVVKMPACDISAVR